MMNGLQGNLKFGIIFGLLLFSCSKSFPEEHKVVLSTEKLFQTEFRPSYFDSFSPSDHLKIYKFESGSSFLLEKTKSVVQEINDSQENSDELSTGTSFLSQSEMMKLQEQLLKEAIEGNQASKSVSLASQPACIATPTKNQNN
ncbi:MAG: hypothetical protein HQM08_21370 [Candidatus Riflebacteria bacterium]|nr:hypothetical protein [Candidatus Riflebacteria bacterium]